MIKFINCFYEVFISRYFGGTKPTSVPMTGAEVCKNGFKLVQVFQSGGRTHEASLF